MGGKGSGGGEFHPPLVIDGKRVDWPALLAEYEADWEPLGESYAAFARDKGINRTTVAAKFKHMKDKKQSILKTAHARNLPILLKSQKKMQAALDQANVEPEFALKVFRAVFEREEPISQVNTQVNVVVPPMFASPIAMEAAKRLMESDPDPLPLAQEAALKLTQD